MKVLMINGSPHTKGNNYIALHEMEKIFASEGIETEIVQVGNKDIRGCISCNSCFEKADAYSMILSMRQHRNSRPATALWQQVRSIMPRQTRR